MTELVEYYRQTGAFGWPALYFFVILFVTGIVFLFFVKSKRVFIFYLLFTLLPLIIGIIGTVVNFDYLETYMNSNPNVTADELEEVKSIYWMPFKFSLFLSIPLFLIGLVGIIKSKTKT